MNQSLYLSTLTPLRGIAALLVVIFHSSLFLGPIVKPETTLFIQNGWLWVDFFFVLSGFILAHVYGTYFQEGVSWLGYKKYLLARFARIYPLHFVTLWVAVLLIAGIKLFAQDIMPFIQVIFDYKTIPASLLLIQSMHLYITPPLNTPSWSLSTEWWVYVLFPLLVGPFFRLRTVGKIGAFLAIAALFGLLMYYIVPHWGNRYFAKPGELSPATLNVTADWGYIRCLAGFLLGMLFYEIYRHRLGYSLLRSGFAFLAVAIALVVALHAGWHELLVVALFPLLILTAAYNNDFVKRALETRPLQRLGDWSFSIYMVHIPIVFGFWIALLREKPMALSSFEAFYKSITIPGWQYCLAVVGLTLVASALMYRYVEVPARNYLNARFQSKPKEPVAMAM